MEKRTTEPWGTAAPAHRREQLRELVLAFGERPVARDIGVNAQTIARYCAGFGVSLGVRTLIEAYLDERARGAA